MVLGYRVRGHRVGGTSQAPGGSLQALIGGVPVRGRIQLFQGNGVAKMEWVPRRPLGRAFQAKFGNEGELMKTTWPGGQHSPNIAPRWANLAPT